MGLAAARGAWPTTAPERPRRPHRNCTDSAAADLSVRGSPDTVGDGGRRRGRRSGSADVRTRSPSGEWRTEHPSSTPSGPPCRAASEQLSDEQWHTAVDGGVMLAWCTVRRSPITVAGRRARIRQLSAQSTQRQSPELAAYTAAKAMVTSISGTSQLLAPDEIMVNVVSPGSIAPRRFVGWRLRRPTAWTLRPDDRQ